MHPPGTQTYHHSPGLSFNGLAWSPFHEGLLAGAAGRNFGLTGPGKVLVLGTSDSGGPDQFQPGSIVSPSVSRYIDIRQGGVSSRGEVNLSDCVYDVAWSEVNDDQVAAATGDGSIYLLRLSGFGSEPPTLLRTWTEHRGEVVGIDWNNLMKDQFSSASWDGSVKLWTLEHASSVLTINVPRFDPTISAPDPHSRPDLAPQVSSATFSPHSPYLICTASSDGLLRIYDTRATPTMPSQSLSLASSSRARNSPDEGASSGYEALSCDWNKYDHSRLASAGTDGVVRVWDVRVGREVEEARCLGHARAVKKVQWSPHRANITASVGYDMTCRIWDVTSRPTPAILQHAASLGIAHTGPSLTHSHRHTEFAMALAWSLFGRPGSIATGGWDGVIKLEHVNI